MILEKERETVSAPAERQTPEKPSRGPAPRRMIKCPRKTGINMNQREKRTGDVLTLVIGLAVIVLAAGLVAKLGVIDQYRRLSEAQSAYEQVHSQLTACQTELEDYDRVLMEYRSYSMDWMTNSDDSDQFVSVPRQEVLDLVERQMMSRGTVLSVNIVEDTAEVQMSGMTLDQISAMFTAVEAQPIVESVELNIAATEEEKTASILNFSVKIHLQPEVAE